MKTSCCRYRGSLCDASKSFTNRLTQIVDFRAIWSMLAVACLSAAPAAQGLNYRVQGQVFCKDKPMAGANMTVSADYRYQVFNTSDANGTYIIDIPSPLGPSFNGALSASFSNADSCSTGHR